jgi:hypothetical protein
MGNKYHAAPDQQWKQPRILKLPVLTVLTNSVYLFCKPVLHLRLSGEEEHAECEGICNCMITGHIDNEQIPENLIH